MFCTMEIIIFLRNCFFFFLKSNGFHMAHCLKIHTFQARSGGGDSYLNSTESEMSVDVGQAPEDLWSKRVGHTMIL